MHLMPKGDYYIWHCDWCDSTNQTIWTRLEKNDIHCSACQRKTSLNVGSLSLPKTHTPRLRYCLI